MTFRELLKALSPPIAVSLVKRILGRSNSPTRGGLGELDAILAPYLNRRGGYFVELGANDGLRQSNTLRLEESLGWKGLLIEPVVHRYFQLKSNRSSENSYECAACVPFNYGDRWVEMEYGDLMTVAESLPGDLPDRKMHKSSAMKFLPAGEHPVVFGARAVTLQDLLDKHRAPKVVDFLSLDVEGAELQVLKGVDFERTTFRYLLIESRSVDEIVSFLEPKGYVLISKVTFHDYLFQKRPNE